MYKGSLKCARFIGNADAVCSSTLLSQRVFNGITSAAAMQLLSLSKFRTAEILAIMSSNGVIIKKGFAEQLVIVGLVLEIRWVLK